ncbi:magnesium transporter [Lactobacillaceae bacterium L1_55_11]|nr:magnesium transporter [Lactobacillaceae bacterium L1_55_11]
MDNEQHHIEEIVQALVDYLSSGQDDEFVNFFENLHEYEMGQAYAEMPDNMREIAWRVLDDESLATVFDNLEIEPEDEVRLLREMPPQKGAQVLEAMYADNEADLLQGMPSRLVATYLGLMPKEDAQEMRRLIKYEEQSAGALMGTDYLAVHQGQRVADVFKKVKEQAVDAESIAYIYVVDDQHRLVGVMSLRDLLTHPDDLSIDEITNTRVVSVKAGDNQKDVAQVVADYNFLSVPVTDDDQRLLGMITVDDIVDVIDEEAATEYSGLAAVDVTQVDDSAWRSALKRTPWLLILLVLGLGTTLMISGFSNFIHEAPVLAVFITLVAGTAGNAGTQSLALTIRGLSAGNEKGFWKNFGSEILASLILAVFAGLLIGLIVGFWQGNADLGLTVGLGMGVAIFLASLLGFLLPAALDRLGLDPALINGPLLTTICDFTSILIYFGVAQVFINHFLGR